MRGTWCCAACPAAAAGSIGASSIGLDACSAAAAVRDDGRGSAADARRDVGRDRPARLLCRLPAALRSPVAAAAAASGSRSLGAGADMGSAGAGAGSLPHGVPGSPDGPGAAAARGAVPPIRFGEADLE